MQNGYKNILKWYVKKLETRFWKNVNKTSTPGWIWKGVQFGHGYGNFRCCGDSVCRLTVFLGSSLIKEFQKECKFFIIAITDCA